MAKSKQKETPAVAVIGSGYWGKNLVRNFFELGATSLAILQVNNQLKRIFAKEIPVVAMYSYPSIALLAGFLNRETPENDFTANEDHKFEKMDKGQKKLKYLKTKRKKSE